MTLGPSPLDGVLALDTDVLNAWRYQQQPVVRAVSEYIAKFKVPPALTSTTVFEALHGFQKGALLSGEMNERARRDLERLSRLTEGCMVLPFNEGAAALAAHIFPRLSQKERNKHWADLFVAASAWANGYGIATRNRADFESLASHIPPAYQRPRIEIWKS
jgi:predicted nucleic acid-binding protein